MGIWDVFAGAGEAVDPARQWLETVYKIKANKAQREQDANNAALKGVLDLGGRGAIREAAYEKTRKAKEGKGFSLDKFPLQNMSEAYRQEERDPASILSAVGAAQGAYGQNLTDRAGTEFQLKRPELTMQPPPSGMPAADESPESFRFREKLTGKQTPGQMVGTSRAYFADKNAAGKYADTSNYDVYGGEGTPEAADITQTLGNRAAQASRIAQPIRDAYGSIPEYATSPEDEALITSRLKAIDSFPDLRPEVKNVLKQSILAQAAKAKAAGRAQAEAQRQTAVGDATARVYREQRPERTVPALAERAIKGQETAAANKATLEKDIARIREGAQYARLNFDKKLADAAKTSLEETQKVLANRRAELKAEEAAAAPADKQQYRDALRDFDDRYAQFAVTPSIATVKAPPKVTPPRPAGSRTAPAPKPTMETSNAVKQIGNLDRVFLEGSAPEKVAAQAERNRLIDIVKQQMPGQYKKTYKYVTPEEREKLAKQGKTPEQYEKWMLEREGG